MIGLCCCKNDLKSHAEYIAFGLKLYGITLRHLSLVTILPRAYTGIDFATQLEGVSDDCLMPIYSDCKP